MWAKQRQSGFTIVELLIVIVVIAILAAITIVAYNGIQDRARASAAAQGLSNAAKKIKYWQAEQDTTAAPATLSLAGITDSANVSYQYTQDLGGIYCITATVNGKSYKLTGNTTQSAPGACPGHGADGVAAITNLISNPSSVNNVTNYSMWPGNGGGVLAQSKVTSTWAARGYAARGTWSVQNTTYTGDAGYVTPNSGVNALEPNTQYTARWRAVSSKNQRLQPFAGNWMILNGAMGTGSGTINAVTAPAVVSANTPFDQWITFTTGANTVALKFGTNLAAGTGASYWNSGDYLEISELMLTKGSTLYNYADGNSDNWVWNGTTPHNVTSTGPPQ